MIRIITIGLPQPVSQDMNRITKGKGLRDDRVINPRKLKRIRFQQKKGIATRVIL